MGIYRHLIYKPTNDYSVIVQLILVEVRKVLLLNMV